MNQEQQVEWEEIKEKTEAVRLGFDLLEDRAGILRVCLDPETASGDQLTVARQRLARFL